ncbi:MAG TPA: branched-chain amino acid ABC transporter permease [Halococcus sp.]|nr:branched-chain amino acid ABC transporter permease [Halococcus sp.]
MVDAATIAVNAAIISALYALVAIGFTLIFGVGGVLNLAHGASITVGAFAAYYTTTVFSGGLGIPLLPVLVAIAAAAVFSALLYVVMIGRVEDDPIMVLILTLVTAVAIEQLVLAVFGSQPKVLPSILTGQMAVAGVQIEINRFVVFVLSWVLIGALFAFVNYTKTGKAVLATSMTDKGAALVGIDSDHINLLIWVLAGAFAGLAGYFLGSLQGASWVMGRNPLVLSFSIVILGGVGSIRGSVVGAYLIGILEVLTVTLVDASLAGLSSLVVLVLVLLIKPEGLFGRELVE